MRRRRLFALVSLVILGLAAGVEVAGAASPKIVDITRASSIVSKQKTVFISKADPHRCVIVTFALFPSVKGATSYSVLARGLSPSHDVSGGGPPFTYDHYVATITPTVKVVFNAPRNAHWFPIFSGASGNGCETGKKYASTHFSIAKATATVAAGTVTQSSSGSTTLKCSTARKGPTLGKRGERLVIIRKRGVVDVVVNGKTQRLTTNRRYVTGKFRVHTHAGAWALVGEVKPNDTSTNLSARSVLVTPGTTVEFEAGRPLRVIQWTPGLSKGTPPTSVGAYRLRTNGCVTVAR